MDICHLNALTATLAGSRTRRGILATLAGVPALLGLTEAAAGRRKQRKKLIRNEFGCVAVGGKCRGSDGNCCSGVCQGKKPKKGKKDKSVCVAHNTGGCTLERDICVNGTEESICNGSSACAKTTGNAPFCGTPENVECRICSTDRDCEAQGFPFGSACVILTGGECVGADDCNGVNGSSGTACAAPGA